MTDRTGGAEINTGAVMPLTTMLIINILGNNYFVNQYIFLQHNHSHNDINFEKSETFEKETILKNQNKYGKMKAIHCGNMLVIKLNASNNTSKCQ